VLLVIPLTLQCVFSLLTASTAYDKRQHAFYRFRPPSAWASLSLLPLEMIPRTPTTFPLLISMGSSPSVQPPSMTPSPRSPTLVTRSISSPQAWTFSLPATCPILPLPCILVLVWLRESCHSCLVHLRVCRRANGNSPTVLTSPASHSYSWGQRESSPLMFSPGNLL